MLVRIHIGIFYWRGWQCASLDLLFEFWMIIRTSSPPRPAGSSIHAHTHPALRAPCPFPRQSSIDSRASAQSTALSAAPRSSWSPHTNRSSPLSPNTALLRMRPTWGEKGGGQEWWWAWGELQERESWHLSGCFCSIPPKVSSHHACYTPVYVIPMIE